ncbi:hypothetical protein L2E82_48900 [Cichorium intybus]|uniref:Uncharacterized protein n=1 Tax=Cichorium intybus TaxID=13427 RepID=A0ACB8YZ33_CICIN|nr:hypothetical protein L2E82_48900 [Cichorium intybus]
MCALPLEGCLLANKITQPRTLKTGSMYPRFELPPQQTSSPPSTSRHSFNFYQGGDPYGIRGWFVFNGPVQNDLEVESTDYVIVCDICRDVGREDLLAICSTCKDGAEHTYCMKLMINEVPMGDWQCEECKSSEECQMFEVLNEGKGRIPKTPSEEVQTKEKPKEFADEQ